MFRGTRERRHCEKDDTALKYLTEATQKLLDKYKVNTSEIDLFLSNSAMLDIPFTGPGAGWAHAIESHPRYIYDIHNSGCTSFVNMLELADILMQSRNIRYALIGNTQTSAGKIFAHPQNRNKQQSCRTRRRLRRYSAYASEQETGGRLLESSTRSHGEFASDMNIERPDGCYWWEPSDKMGIIEFNQTRIMKIISRGNRSVPERIKEVCEKNRKTLQDIDVLITNQPNPVFLRNWREFVGLPEEKLYHTFEKYGNLFSAAMPINLSEALEKGIIQEGDLVCIAGFSHAGDYSSAILVQY